METWSDYIAPRPMVLDRTESVEKQLESLRFRVYDEAKMKTDMETWLRNAPVPGWFAYVRYLTVYFRGYLAVGMIIAGLASIILGAVGTLQGSSPSVGAWMSIGGIISLVVGFLVMRYHARFTGHRFVLGKARWVRVPMPGAWTDVKTGCYFVLRQHYPKAKFHLHELRQDIRDAYEGFRFPARYAIDEVEIDGKTYSLNINELRL